MAQRFSRIHSICFIISLAALASPVIVLGELHEGEEAPALRDSHVHRSHEDVLHFLHPLVTESPLPENEARLAFTYENLVGTDGHQYTLASTLEIAPVRWFSVEFSAPFSHIDSEVGPSESRVGDLSLGLKFACFALEEQGILLASGIEFGLPTGNEERGIGNDHVLEIEPWLGFGVKCERWEWLGRFGIGIPVNQNGDREADVEIEWATSVLFHLIENRLALLIELDGLSVLGGTEDGFNNISITPGIRVFPFASTAVSVGAGVRLPLTDDRESHMQGIFSLFLHY